MLSKEEIETCKEEISNYIEFMESIGDNAGWARGLKWYIKQLETDKQKLIEKLEEDKNNLEFSRDLDADKGFGEDEEDMAVRSYIEEILELVKGEKE